jgi:class 3 adenylate cyclase
MPWKPQRYSLTEDIPVARSIIWSLLSDTDRLNRVINLPFVEYGEVKAGSTSATREAWARASGIPMRWREFPFQWEKEKHYIVRREYASGPIALFEGGLQLEELPSTETGPMTRVCLYADIQPSGPLGAAAVPVMARENLRKSFAHLRAQLAADTAHADTATHPTEKPCAAVNRQAMHAALRDLPSGTLPEGTSIEVLSTHLQNYLLHRSDSDVLALRPHLLANAWDIPLGDIIRFCLHAARAGLLNLHWCVLCPNCRVTKASYTSLSNLQESLHCDLCGINYKTMFDRYVELRFAVHPAIRKAQDHTYCIGGPAITPHVWVQKIVAPGQRATLPMPRSQCAFRIRVLRANHVVLLSADSDNPRDSLVLSDEGWDQAIIACPSAGSDITVCNDTAEEAVVVLEETEWSVEAVTAAQVTAMQEFRDLFSSEVLAPGHQVSIEQITLFFSDLLSSTTLYEEAGDASAYGRVRRHFDYMTGHIAANNGAVVKTIGDAVMAVFYSPADGARAALAIQRHIREGLVDERISLKIGLHHGPAIVVNSNGLLDYFGRNVNIAARIEGASHGGDIILSETCWSQPEVRRVFNTAGIVVDPFEATLKGIERSIFLFRAIVWPSDDPFEQALQEERRRQERRSAERRSAEHRKMQEQLYRDYRDDSAPSASDSRDARGADSRATGANTTGANATGTNASPPPETEQQAAERRRIERRSKDRRSKRRIARRKPEI